MQTKLSKAIEYFIYFYLAIPVIIFCIGWLKWWCATAVVALIVFSVFLSVRESGDYLAPKGIFKGRTETIIGVLVVVFFWVLLSGIGSFVWVNSDQYVRKAIFRCLVEYDWPVMNEDGSRALVYYIGFWLPSAVIGKIFGLSAGYAAQFVWAIIGILIVYYIISINRQKFTMWPLLLFIFFSGMDYLGVQFLRPALTDLSSAYHLEWWASDFQFSSFTTQLFWVFNQALPAWVTIAFIYIQKKNSSIFFILSLCIISSPFPFVGMIPIAIYCVFRNAKEQSCNVLRSKVVSIPNLIGVIAVGIISVLYLFGNASASVVGEDQANVWEITSVELVRYALFLLLEVGVFLILLYKRNKKNALYYIILIEFLLCPILHVGYGHDFCMRASIPALFLLYLFVVDALEAYAQEKNLKMLIPLVVALLFGAITPYNEIHRTILRSFECQKKHELIDAQEGNVESVLYGNNFSGATENEQMLKKILFK